MRIQFCSDLHLEFPENRRFLGSRPLSVNGEILLLAGDIVPFAVMERFNNFLSFVSDNFEQTYWIPGNHEYYHSDISLRSGVLNEEIRSNVHLVNNHSVIHKHLRIICSTLWSKISPHRQWTVQRSLSDFHVIRSGSNTFTPEEYNNLHRESVEFIEDELKNGRFEKTVVATHHVPTFLNYPDKYRGDVLNEAFATELSDFIDRSNIDYWIFGHHHQNTPEFQIGNTAMVTNQLGYVGYNEHLEFSNERIITI